MLPLRSFLGDAVLFDMTNMIALPIRTGIQRVTHQLALHWPKGRPLIPFKQVGADRIALLNPEILLHTERHFSAGDDLIQRAAKVLGSKGNAYSEGYYRMKALGAEPGDEIDAVAAADAARAVLSLELSLSIDFYGRLADAVPEKIYLLNYDYIAWVNPEFNTEIDWNAHETFSDYISMVRKIPNQSFISTLTRDTYYRYIGRRGPRDHPIIIPGTDGLGTGLRDHVGERAEFVVIGTIEPRKQHLPIMQAIEAVQAEGLDVHLTVIGKMGWLTPEDKRTFLHIVDTNSRIDWLEGPADDELTAALKRARASIFFSRTEGFGGPPVESLSLGVPIIVSNTTPSILDLPDVGQIRVDPDDHEGLRAAIRLFADPEQARAKQDEIATLELPTWRSFIEGISSWIDRGTSPVTFTLGLRERLDALRLGRLVRAGAPAERILPELFELLLGRPISAQERDDWSQWSRARKVEGPALVLAFIEAAAVDASQALRILPLILLEPAEIEPAPVAAADAPIPGVVDTAAAILLLPNDRSAAERVYTDINLRTGSAEEHDAWETTLATDQTSRLEFVAGSFAGEEFRQKHGGQSLGPADEAAIRALSPLQLLARIRAGDDRAFLTTLYKVVLQRDVDASGEATYFGSLRAGRSRAEVALDVLLSKEAGHLVAVSAY